MKLGDRAFVFVCALICANLFCLAVKITSALLGSDSQEGMTLALATVVVYWRLMDKGGLR